MSAQILRVAIRLVLCGLLGWAAWRWMDGPAGIAIAAPGFGALLARPLIDLVAHTHRTGKEIALADLQGRYFHYRGNGIDIADDEEDHRWLLAADVRKVLPGLPRDATLQLQFPGRVQALPPVPGVRIRADALLEFLRKASDAPSIRFKVWIEREVIYPTGKTARKFEAGESA